MLKSRHSLIAAILILYFIPLFVMGSYSLRWLSVEQSWNMISLSILLASCGSIAIYGFLYFWEVPKAEVPSIPIPDTRLEELQAALDLKNQELQTLQNDAAHYRKLSEDLDNEKLLFSDSLEEQLIEKNKSLSEHTHTIETLTHDLEISRQKSEELEIKVNDLSYEIKTLLQLSVIEEPLKEEDPFATSEPIIEPHYEPPVVPNKEIGTPQEAALQLKRCLDIAQKITGYQNRDGRFSDIPVNNIVLDQRHLFDNLRSEHAATILFYSKKEEKLLFANNQTKSLLGWSPDKVIQDFSELTLEGFDDWKKATQQSNSETQLSLKMKTKSGDPLAVKALIGTIPSGVFRQDLVAVLYH